MVHRFKSPVSKNKDPVVQSSTGAETKCQTQGIPVTGEVTRVQHVTS